MATVMSWGNSEGIQGRCDSKCHYARLPECDCMCEGQYHGKGLLLGGLERAVREYGGEILKSAQQRAANEGLELKATSIGELLTVLSKKRGILDLDGDKGVL